MSKKASENVRYYKNPNGPCISTVSRRVIEKDGLYFKDLDGSGEFRPYDDWRLSPEKRAAAYVKVLSVDAMPPRKACRTIISRLFGLL